MLNKVNEGVCQIVKALTPYRRGLALSGEEVVQICFRDAQYTIRLHKELQ